MDPQKFAPARLKDLVRHQDPTRSTIPYNTTLQWNTACIGRVSTLASIRRFEGEENCNVPLDSKIRPSKDTLNAFPRLDDDTIWPTGADMVRHQALTGTDFSFFASACEREFSLYGTRFLAMQLLGEGAKFAVPQRPDNRDMRTDTGTARDCSLPAWSLIYPIQDMVSVGLSQIPTCQICGKEKGHHHGCMADVCPICFQHLDDHTSLPVCRFSKGWIRWSDGAVIPRYTSMSSEQQEIRSIIQDLHVAKWYLFKSLRDEFITVSLTYDNREHLYASLDRQTGLVTTPPEGYYSTDDPSADPNRPDGSKWHDIHEEDFMRRFCQEIWLMNKLEEAFDDIKTRWVEKEVQVRLLSRACAHANMSPYGGKLYEVDESMGQEHIHSKIAQAAQKLVESPVGGSFQNPLDPEQVSQDQDSTQRSSQNAPAGTRAQLPPPASPRPRRVTSDPGSHSPPGNSFAAQLSTIYPGLSHLRPAPFTTYTSPYNQGRETRRLRRKDSAVEIKEGEEEAEE